MGAKKPLPHRFHLSNGRVLEGAMHRAPNARLADHLSTLKGYVSITDVRCVATGDRFAYVAVNQDHILFIEELPAATEPAGATLPGRPELELAR